MKKILHGIIISLSFLGLFRCGSDALVSATASSSSRDLLTATLLDVLRNSVSGSSSTLGSGTPTTAQKLRGIWIVGGYNGSSIVNTTDLYDPETDTYFQSAGPALGVARAHIGLVSMSGKLYAIGGITSAGAASSSVEMLDISGNASSWTSEANLTTAKIAPIVGRIGDRLYAVMGSATVAPLLNGVINEFSGTAWSAPYAALAAGNQRIDGCGAVINGVLYVAGGRNATNGWNLTTDGWVQAGSNAATSTVTGVTEPGLTNAAAPGANLRRWGCTAEGISNALTSTLFIIGGTNTTPATNNYPIATTALTVPLNGVSVVNTGATAFSTELFLLTARAFPASAMVTSGSYQGLYVLGGGTSGGALRSIEYLPISGASFGVFAEKTSMTAGRYGAAATTLSL
ncbi:MAG: hypothetical protein HS115_19580 [Spirochaetales bacterium]|nr:hypothetical protein [Spirochaetales bacterium]